MSDPTVKLKLQVLQDGLQNIGTMIDGLEQAGIETSSLRDQAGKLATQLGELTGEVSRGTSPFEQLDKALGGAGGGLTEMASAAAKAVTPTEQAAAEAGALAAMMTKLGTVIEATQRLDELRAKSDQVRASLQNAERVLADYEDYVGGAAKATQEEAAQLSAMENRVREARVAFLAHNDAVSQAEARMRELGVEVEQTAAAESRAADDAQAMATATRRMGSEAQVADENISKTRRGLESISTQLRETKDQIVGFFAAQASAQAVGEVAKLADAWKNMEGRLRIALGAQTDVNAAMQAVVDLSLRTYSSLQATTDLYTKLNTLAPGLVKGQQDALRLTETIAKASQLGGASAQATEAALVQLNQALQSGVLRGDEFNSIMEQSPRLAQAMADGLGVPRTALRSLAEQGQLTAQAVIQALRNQSQAIDAEFTQLPVTIERAVTNLQTQWARLVGTVDSGIGGTAAVASGINLVANNLDALAGAAERAGAVLVTAMAVQGVAALRAAAAEMSVTGAAAKLLAADLATLSRPVQIAISVTGFELGYQIGTWLRENFTLARQLGVGIAEFTTALVNDLRFVAEAAAAVFTSDTVSAAWDRYKQRAEEQQAIYRDLYAETEQAPARISQAAQAAQAPVQQLGATGQAAGQAVAGGAAAGASGLSAMSAQASATQTAIQQLATAANVQLPAIGSSVRQQAQALADMALKSRDVASAISKDLPEAIAKLSGSDLEQFRSVMVGALSQSKDQAQLLRQVIVEVGQRAGEALGVDVVAASRSVSAEFRTAEDNLSILIRSTDALKASGVDMGKVVTQALEKMIEQARNTAELDAVRNRIEALGKAGQVSEKQLTEMFDQLKAKSDQLTEGINSVDEALKKFGLTGKAEATKTADAFAEAWKRIEYDGTVTMENKRAAFQKYAEAVIASGDQVKIKALEMKAGFYDLEIATDAAGQSFVRAKDSASDLANHLQNVQTVAAGIGPTLKGMNDQLEREVTQQERLNQLQERAQALKNKERNVDANGFSLDSTGKQTINAAGNTYLSIVNWLKSAGLDDKKAQEIAGDFVDARGDVPYMNNPGQAKWGGSTLSDALSHAAQSALFGSDRSGASQKTPSKASNTDSTASGGTSSSSTSHVVEIKLGTTTTSVNTASESDATSLVNVLKQLQTEAARAS
ncbi:tape measure protein [Ideonella dechloratans]|uniref:tape measure protein n=1 Tax=Ideonella dechloratans TaxID=36863 RepID=UPI0035AD7FFD